jgi:ribonuclease J
MIEMIRPRFFVPVHGEYRQLHHHAQVALESGIPRENVLVVEDGRVVEVGPEEIRARDDNVAGLVFVDGLGIGDVEQVVLRDRRHLAGDGLLVAQVGIDRLSGEVRTGPELISRGFIDPELSDDLMRDARAEVMSAVRRAGARADPSLLQESIHDSVSRLLWKRTHRRPMVIPLVTEL